MGHLDINPRHRKFLTGLGLNRFEDFVGLAAVVISGHPNRNVSRVTLGTGSQAQAAFLKCEHRVPWRDRMTSLAAGFGPVSKSRREAQLLQDLERAEIGCPEWMAVGEDDDGRAFLLIAEVPGALELREYLDEHRSVSGAERQQFCRSVGTLLGKIHAAGFDHPDLYSKHVFVTPADGRIRLLDWQRSRRRLALSPRQRWRDLAALHATVADDLATPRERLACLIAYLRVVRRAPNMPVSTAPRRSQCLVAAVAAICKETTRLLHLRRIRELRRPHLPLGTQNLVRLDGEALCLTKEFFTSLPGRIPDWLIDASHPTTLATRVERTTVAVPTLGQALLVVRIAGAPLRRLGAWLRGRAARSPELRQAGLLFRLQRYAIPTPHLLAVGQRDLSAWRSASFLLTDSPPDVVRLDEWLGTAPAPLRHRGLRQLAELIQRVHAAGCCFGQAKAGLPPFVVRQSGEDRLQVRLDHVDGIQIRRKSGRIHGPRDLARVRDGLDGANLSRTDQLRLLLAYLGQRRLARADRPSARQFLKTPRLRPARARRTAP